MDKKFNLGNKIYRKKTIDKVNNKISLLGVNSNLNAISLLNIRLIASISIFFMLLYFIDYGYLISPFITFIFYISFIPILLDYRIERRRKLLEKEALYFFEVLALSLESGKSIKSAIEITALNTDSNLSLEFRKVVKDISYGKNLNEALNDLKSRIPSDTINNIILNIREANIFGNNVIETIFSQVEYIRAKKILEAKATISKIPVKISVVSIIFFLPLLLLLLLGPMIINILS